MKLRCVGSLGLCILILSTRPFRRSFSSSLPASYHFAPLQLVIQIPLCGIFLSRLPDLVLQAGKFLDESPQFLASCGRYDECEQVLLAVSSQF